MPNGAELFVGAAAHLGIDSIFTLVGDHLNEVLLAAVRAGLRVVGLRHESGVTHAADAWARIHRKPALALVTGGPGHTNSLTGIATANLAGSPLIAVSGGRPTTLAWREAFQDIDQVAMARPVVKWAAEPPCAAEIPFYLARAYALADTARKGAVHLTIPIDVLLESCEPVLLPDPASRLDAPPDPAGIERAVALLRAARRPVVIAGSGIWWARAEDALRRFIERTSLPLYTITMARGTVSDEHPLVMGYADPALNYAVHTAFREADLFLVIGKRIDYRLAMGGPRLFPPHARFIQIDVHPGELGLNRKLDLAICADARLALEALSGIAGPTPWPPLPWLDRLRGLRNDWEAHLSRAASDSVTAIHPAVSDSATSIHPAASVAAPIHLAASDSAPIHPAASGAAPIHPAAFFRELNAALPRDVLFSWDGGDFAHWGRASLPAREPGGWLRLGPLGTIGSSLPNGLALQLAHPGRKVAIITGDGALGFYLAEMDSATRHKLPVVIIVGNDAGWGLERELQTAASGSAATVACELQSARYDAIMKAFGGDGETIERLAEVRPAVDRAFRSSVPYCLNVKIRGVRSPFTEWQIAGKKR